MSREPVQVRSSSVRLLAIRHGLADIGQWPDASGERLGGSTNGLGR
jgi:hypothetical protein